jgi:hypothetical protein
MVKRPKSRILTEVSEAMADLGQRFNTKTSDWTPTPEIDAFLEEIVAVCKKHGLSIGHEDTNGGFRIHKYDEAKVRWLREAANATQED